MNASRADAVSLPRAAALPVAFERTVGLFTAAKGTPARAAVLFLSPWGLEELCVRKAWRELADALSEAGIASLRYDHPGTGDALDIAIGMNETAEPAGALEPFIATAHAAAHRLLDLCGIGRIVIIAQGFGAVLVPALLQRLRGDRGGQVEAVALLAPVTSGRRYLRELSLWSKVVDEGLGLPSGSSGPGTAIAGFVMDEGLAASVRAVDPKAFTAVGDTRFFIAERPQSDGDAALSRQLADGGALVQRVDFEGYSELVSNPTIAEPPLEIFRQLEAWILEGVSAPATGEAAAPGSLPSAGVLDGGTFMECPMRFGAGDRLYGILCTPSDVMPVGTALLMGTGYDRQSGWARSTAETARMLAASGIASMRFDAAGVADSPSAPGGDRQVLYSPKQVADVRAALDLIETIGLPDPVFVGRCSGAYLAFNAALADTRCRGVIAINILTFAWDPRDDVDQMIRYNPRSIEDYTQRAFRMETAYRLFSGKIDVPRAAGNILKLASRHISRMAAPLLKSLSTEARLRTQVHGAFRQLRERHVPVLLVYSEGDIGLARLSQHFGRDGQGLDRYPNVTRISIADADHNVTPPAARRRLREMIREAILLIQASSTEPS
jgi:alpha-beta hydrolase superfamily lysophospholipase